MKKTYGKFLRRSVWKTKARFFSILAIVAIGVGFLSGLLSATPDMRLTLDLYYDEHLVHDLNVKGPMGLTDDDMAAIAAISGVDSVTPAYVTDLILNDTEGSFVTRLYGMPQGEGAMDNSLLLEGRMPETDSECLIAAPNRYSTSVKLGEKLTLSADNKDFDTLGDTYAFTELTVVGLVETPLYFSATSEPSTVGSGKIQLVVFTSGNAYSLDVYTDALIRLTGVDKLDTFSDEYSRRVMNFYASLERLGIDRSVIRRDEIKAVADKELAKAEIKYDDGKAEADTELAKAAKKLEDGKKEIEDNRQKLINGKKELEDGKIELADGEKKLDDGKKELADGRAKMKANRLTLEDSKKALEESRQTLANTIAEKRQEFVASVPGLAMEQYRILERKIDKAEAAATAELDKSEATLKAGEAEIAVNEETIKQNEADLQAGRAQYEGGLAQYNGGMQALADGKAALEAIKDTLTEKEYLAQKAILDGTEASLTETKRMLDATYATLSAGEAALAEGKTALESAKAELASGRKQLEAGRTKLETEISANREELKNSLPTIEQAVMDAGMAEIDAAEASALAEIDAGAEQISQGEAALNEAEAALVSGEAELLRSEATLNDGKATIAENEQKLLDGERELADGEKELTDGKATYLVEKAKAEKELSDAREEIDTARADITNIKLPEWMIFDREDIVSFWGYKGDSGKVGAIATIFPIFFFLVAALVALTTMTRLVEEERTQIGVFKALGYSNSLIILYYLGYSMLASLLGSLIGVTLGSFTLPIIISNAYAMNYSLPPLIVHFWWSYALIIVFTAIFCTTLAAWAACMSQLREKPSALMLPKAPQVGKRIFLERITPLWKKLSFTQKITARNIFRYKKRFSMTVIGIAGCAALLLTGLGLQDSIQDIGKKQFGEIYKYDVSLTMSEDAAKNGDAGVDALLNDSTLVSSYLPFSSENGYAGSKSCTLSVPKKAQELTAQINLRNMKSGAGIEFGESSAVITQKLSENLGLKNGDSLTVQNSDGIKSQITITGITESYVSSTVFLAPELYKKSFGSDPVYKEALITLTSTQEDFRDQFSEKMLANDGAILLLFNQEMENSFSDSVKSIDAIVMVLVFSAGALAIIVLYNLTNINICERKKELATIKVLGFRKGEVALYIYRETMILSIIGIAFGLVLGIFLHGFVIRTAEMDNVMFGRTIYAMSYILSAALTIVFTLLVDVIMLKKLRKIDMVESMKANE